MAKRKVDFRLSGEAVDKLDEIAGHFGLSRTAALEIVMKEVARRDMREFVLGAGPRREFPVDTTTDEPTQQPGSSGSNQEVPQGRKQKYEFCEHGALPSLCKFAKCRKT